MSSDEKTNTTISCLQHAIEDAQGTIRAYDTKAEILAILLTLAIGITNFTLIPRETDCSKWILVSSWIVGLVAIAILGLALHPRKDQFKNINLGNYTPSGTYFMFNLLSSPQNTVTNLATRALETDWVLELIYENMKLSVIRENKHYWFIWALKLSGITLGLIVAAIVLVI